MIAVSAFLAATAITEKTGYTNVFAMMEPFLPRLMSRSGINFGRAGADIEYHGTRTLFHHHAICPDYDARQPA